MEEVKTCNQCKEKKELYCFKKVFNPVIKKRVRMEVCKTCVKKNKLKNSLVQKMKDLTDLYVEISFSIREIKNLMKMMEIENSESEPESNIGYFSDGGTYHGYDVVDN